MKSDVIRLQEWGCILSLKDRRNGKIKSPYLKKGEIQMLKNKKILFLILMVVLLLLIPNIVKATTITRIDITIPEPIVGKTPAEISDVTVKGTDENGTTVPMTIESVGWEDYDEQTPLHILSNDEIFITSVGYSAQVCFNHSNEYQLPWEQGAGFDTSAFNLYLNGKEITGINSRNYLRPMVSQENPVRWAFEYDFGEAKFEQYLSSIDVKIPSTNAGGTRSTASNITAKGNGSISFDVYDVRWAKYNPNTKTNEEFTGETLEKDTEYSVFMCFDIPLKYGINSNTVVKVNGVTYAMPGDETFDYGKAGGPDGYEASLKYSFSTAVPIFYSILEGKDPTYTIGKDKTLTFKIDAPVNKFTDIFLDDEEEAIDPKNYEVKEGSTVVTFKEDYLKTLANGKHVLMFLFEDGYAISDLTIVGANDSSGITSTNDTTKAPGKIPYAGGTLVIILSSALLVIAGGYALKKSKDLKGI